MNRPAASNDQLRFPRRLEAEPAAAERLRKRIAAGVPLSPEGELRVAVAPFDARLLAALRSARSASRLVQGLEAASHRLAVEARGLRMVDTRSGDERGQRVSRLLLVSNDGSPRFYREVEALVRRHEPRVLAFRLEADSHALGEPLFGRERIARLVMVEHKEAVSATLLALAGEVSQGDPAVTP